jgi:LysE type translocator
MDIVIPNATSIGVFSLAAILLLLTPGPAVLYIVARSIEQGRIAGLASVCGITTGTLVHVLAAALGLSALLASSALAFAVVKYAGAGYLVYIGVRRILSRADTRAVQIELPRRSLGRLYRDVRRQSAESEDSAVLLGLLAAIRRSLARRGGVPDRLPRSAVHIDGSDERWSLCVGRRHGWAMGQAQWPLLALGTLRHRWRVYRTRRDRRLCWQRAQIADWCPILPLIRTRSGPSLFSKAAARSLNQIMSSKEPLEGSFFSAEVEPRNPRMGVA